MSLILVLRSLSKYVLSTSVGVLSLTGSDTSITVRKVLRAETATFVVTPVSAGFIRDEKLIVSEGRFTLTGSNTDISKGNYLQANTAIYNLNGNDVAFRKDIVLQANTGIYNLSGNNANFIVVKPEPPIPPEPIFGGGGVGLGFASDKVDSNVDFREKDEQEIIDIIKIFLRCQ